MSNVRETPKRFRYGLLHDGQLYRYNDPDGWESLTYILTRSDWHGVGAEQSQQLRFGGRYHDLLTSVYERTGIYSDVILRVDHRNEDWTYSHFADFQLDFSTYEDDFNYVTISVREISYRDKINANMETEYELTFPASSSIDNLLEYKGIRRIANNVLQYTSPDRSGGRTNKYRPISGAMRSARAYDPDLTFNGDGTDNPATRFEVTVNRDITFNDPLTVTIQMNLCAQIISYDKDEFASVAFGFKYPGDEQWTPTRNFTPTFTSRIYVPASNPEASGLYYHYYEWVINPLTLSLPELSTGVIPEGTQIGLIRTGYLIFRSQFGDRNGQGSSGFAGMDTYMRVSKFAASPNDNRRLQVVTFRDMLTSLLAKIDPNITFTSSLDTINPDSTRYIHVVSSPDFMRNIGSAAGGKIVTTLKNALTALNVVDGIGVDVTGRNLHIAKMDEFYLDSPTPMNVNANGVVISHVSEHVYNTVKVSSKFDAGNESGNMSLFADKVWDLRDGDSPAYSSDESELSLDCPYIIDPLVIDQRIGKYATNETVGDSTSSSDIVMIAVVPFRWPYLAYTYQDISSYSGDSESLYNLPYTPARVIRNHMRLLAVSMVGKTPNKMAPLVADGSQAYARTRLMFESTYVDENAPLDFTGVTPLFLPMKAEFSTDATFNVVDAINENKYGLVSIRYRGRTIKGWVSEVSSSIGKHTTQEWGLIIKEITD